MAEIQFTAQYERKFSDGNYGSEGLSLSVTVACSEEDLDGGLKRRYARDLRQMVLGFLATSSAERVPWAAKRELEGKPQQQVPAGVVVDNEDEDLPY